MIEKIKKDRLKLTLVAIASAALAVATTVAVIMLVLKQNYTPMWFVLGVSAICYYSTVFFAFFALDRNTAVKVVLAIDALGTSETVTLADNLGWNIKATEKFKNKLIKWGYIS